ncbi:DUF4961 domain-containing protein [Arachidicoccus sp.]|uniref:DUF4961 domain-containing protein n=1 Tax=Arachidicoccus sp. TaxID=1872624 RepID=UPI003D210FB6
MSKIAKFLKKKSARWMLVLMALITVAVVSCSITIDSVDQPSYVNGGDSLHVTLNVTINTNATENSKFMVALLVPQLWNIRQNAKITFTSTTTTGVQNMTVIPVGTAAPQGNGLDWPTLLANRIGHGGNLLSGWEWVAFYSDNSYSVNANDKIGVTIHINEKVSNDNISFKTGYVVANSSDGLSDAQYYASAFPGCFEVNGTGDLLDFCNPQISTVTPLNSLDNDIITLGFDGGVVGNALENESAIYLCLKGTTTDGKVLDACRQDSTSMLRSTGLKKWSIDIWPRGFLGLQKGEHLASLQYYFTDKTGTIKVGKTGDASTPFSYTFKCQ